MKGNQKKADGSKSTFLAEMEGTAAVRLFIFCNEINGIKIGLKESYFSTIKLIKTL